MINLNHIVEALLFASDKPLSTKQLQSFFADHETPSLTELETSLAELEASYHGRGIQLKRVASGYRFQVVAELSPWVSRLFEEKPARYSRAFLETLAIIAYRQPVTRAEIEDIRGVAVSSNIIRSLLEREWVKIIAHKEAPGRPALYGTTAQFLDYFNLSSLTQLPTLQAIQSLSIDPLTDPSQAITDERTTTQTETTTPIVSPETSGDKGYASQPPQAIAETG